MKKKKLKIKNIRLLVFIILSLLIVFTIISYFIYRHNAGYSKYLKINLNGQKEVKVEYGEDYTDSGATAFYKDKDITKNIKIKNNLNLEKVGNYKYTYSIKYKAKKKQVVRKVNVVDTVKPEITLNGKDEVTLSVGDTYKEEFAKAYDNYDGDISEKVVLTGEIDTGKVGEYTIVYTVNDSSLNEAQVERKVIVVEKVNKKTNSNTEVVGKTSKDYKIEKRDGVYYINNILIVNKTYGLPSTYNPGDLVNAFNENFSKMQKDAKSEGISLNVISGFRSYSRQNTLYNNYVDRDGKEKADTYSARPGHSEHQTGLAADINSLSQSWENTEEGKWLNNNCYKYGFIIRYVKGKEDQTGYIYEPWHIRYVGEDVAKKLYNNGDWLTLEEYLGITSKY